MASTALHSLHAHHLPIPLLPDRSMATIPLPNRPLFPSSRPKHHSLRGGAVVARFSPSFQLPDLEGVEEMARELLGRAEGVIYTVADAAVSSSDVAAQGSKQSGDWLSGITNTLETVLKILKDGLSALHVPYSYGFAIILLTVIVKAATFPLTKKQVESAIAMRSLQPQVKAIQQLHAGDQERIQLETARLYKLAGVNPLAGCLPTLAAVPIWIGLYRALSNVADEGLLTEGFFWIPSLSGPTSIAARQSGSGISWLFPFVDGHPPLGWSDTFAYLVLPALLVVSQYISAQIMQPTQGSDPSQNSAQTVTKLLPLMIGYFALSVPSGLSLYWLTNNILSTAQQIWLQKLGGAKNPIKQYTDRAAKDELLSTQNSISSIQKPISDLETDKAKLGAKEKTDSGGPRPGERFKQIKELEARRRKQREEERRAEEAARVPITSNNQQNPENKIAENKDEQINGNLEQIMERNWNEVDVSTTRNGGVNNKAGHNVVDEGISHGTEKKEEAAETHLSSTNQTSTHDSLDTRVQETERGQSSSTVVPDQR